MNPDKLFDYLDGRLPDSERADLEERLMYDKQLQRELGVARQIHERMRDDLREVVLPPEADVAERGRKMALRVGTAFIVLMGVNVAFGLWLIFRHESNNPNRTLLEKQMREQIAKSIDKAVTLGSAGSDLGISEIKLSAATGKLDTMANEVVAIASRLGGSSTKGLRDRDRISVLVDVPPKRESEFRAALSNITGVALPPDSSAFAETNADKATPATAAQPGSPSPATEKKSFVVQIVEE